MNLTLSLTHISHCPFRFLFVVFSAFFWVHHFFFFPYLSAVNHKPEADLIGWRPPVFFGLLRHWLPVLQLRKRRAMEERDHCGTKHRTSLISGTLAVTQSCYGELKGVGML